MTYRKLDVILILGSWIKLERLRNIKILYTHITINKLTATVRKDNTCKYLVLLHVLGFNVSSIKRSKGKGKSYVTTMENAI